MWGGAVCCWEVRTSQPSKNRARLFQKNADLPTQPGVIWPVDSRGMGHFSRRLHFVCDFSCFHDMFNCTKISSTLQQIWPNEPSSPLNDDAEWLLDIQNRSKSREVLTFERFFSKHFFDPQFPTISSFRHIHLRKIPTNPRHFCALSTRNTLLEVFKELEWGVCVQIENVVWVMRGGCDRCLGLTPTFRSRQVRQWSKFGLTHTTRGNLTRRFTWYRSFFSATSLCGHN